MKFFLKIDQEQEPSVTVVCNKVTPAVTKIEALCQELCSVDECLYGYLDEEIIPLDLASVACFFTKDGKVFAATNDKEYVTKLRIKQVLELVDDRFIKINQGCVICIRQIQKFSVSFGGALKVTLKNGYCDYVARREVANIKRRLGL